MVFVTQIVYYGLPWLTWNDRQAVLFDIAARRFYIFGAVFWPQDVIYLAVLLIIAALSLFLFTAIAGRLWCGFACPQTVYTEIFLWIERKIEGSHTTRMRVDREPMTAAKLGKKTLKHAIWIAIALWTGITFVGYFTPFRPLLAGSARRSLGLGGVLGGVLRPRHVRQRGLPARAGLQVHVPVRALPVGDVRPRHARDHLRRGARRAARRARPQGGPRVGGARRLHRLLDLRAGVPDRHRHPQGAAVRVHRVRRVHRRLQPGDGQDELPARPDPLHDGQRARARLRRRHDVEAGVPRAHARLPRAARGDRRGDGGVAVAARIAEGRRDPRSRRARARDGARRDRERLPAADHEHGRDAAAVHDRGRGRAGTRGRRRRAADRDRRRIARLVPVRLQAPADAGKPGANRIEFVVKAVDDAKVARREKSTFLFPR